MCFPRIQFWSSLLVIFFFLGGRATICTSTSLPSRVNIFTVSVLGAFFFSEGNRNLKAEKTVAEATPHLMNFRRFWFIFSSIIFLIIKLNNSFFFLGGLLFKG